MQTVLLVEDDPGISHPLSLYLTESGYRVHLCERGDTALDMFRATAPDLVMLDINLPGRNGMEVCAGIRLTSNIPIIVLSARGAESDKVAALDLGADDYIEKPFSPRELVARVKAVLKRANTKLAPNESGIIKYQNLTLDVHNYSLLVGEKSVRLTKTEFLLLHFLIIHKATIVSRETLMRDIMGYENYLYDRTLDTHIKNLRKKIENENIVETVRGIGYRVK